MVSEHTAGNATVNYGKNNSVFPKLKAENPFTIKANCMARILHKCAKHAGLTLSQRLTKYSATATGCTHLPGEVVEPLRRQLPEECCKLGTEEQVHILPSQCCSGGPPDERKTGHGWTVWGILRDPATAAGCCGEKSFCCGEVVNLASRHKDTK